MLTQGLFQLSTIMDVVERSNRQEDIRLQVIQRSYEKQKRAFARNMTMSQRNLAISLNKKLEQVKQVDLHNNKLSEKKLFKTDKLKYVADEVEILSKTKSNEDRRLSQYSICPVDTPQGRKLTIANRLDVPRLSRSVSTPVNLWMKAKQGNVAQSPFDRKLSANSKRQQFTGKSQRLTRSVESHLTPPPISRRNKSCEESNNKQYLGSDIPKITIRASESDIAYENQTDFTKEMNSLLSPGAMPKRSPSPPPLLIPHPPMQDKPPALKENVKSPTFTPHASQTSTLQQHTGKGLSPTSSCLSSLKPHPPQLSPTLFPTSINSSTSCEGQVCYNRVSKSPPMPRRSFQRSPSQLSIKKSSSIDFPLQSTHTIPFAASELSVELSPKKSPLSNLSPLKSNSTPLILPPHSPKSPISPNLPISPQLSPLIFDSLPRLLSPTNPDKPASPPNETANGAKVNHSPLNRLKSPSCTQNLNEPATSPQNHHEEEPIGHHCTSFPEINTTAKKSLHRRSSSVDQSSIEKDCRQRKTAVFLHEHPLYFER